MTTMIERVARAMFIAEVPGRTRAWPWEDADMKAIPEDCAYERANFERMARAAIEAEQAKARQAARDAIAGIDDDYMTSEAHHPGYVLIPTTRFESIRAALAKIDALTGGEVG